jgi:ATP-dependent helicase/nuclease subunit B
LRDPRVLADLGARPWSASSLELWIACPARWFVERLLRPHSVEPDPEPLARGGLAHAALADVLQGLRERTGSARPTFARLALARELLAQALARHEQDFLLSAMAERVPGVRRRLQADLERYLRHACEQESPLEPTHLELEFGFGGDCALPALDLGDGMTLRGRIDRIDVAPGGAAVVYDYKGASVTPGARWIADGKVQLALYMRAVEQLLGLRVVGGFYQPLAGADLRARGALDGDAKVGLRCVRTDLLDAAGLRSLVAEAIELAREAAAEAVAGAIRARPRTCSHLGGCSHPAICRSGG